MINPSRASTEDHFAQSHTDRARTLLFATALAIVSVGSVAFSGQAEARSSSVRNFFSCLRTPLVHFNGSIVDAAVATDNLSTLVFAVQEAGLVDTLSGPGPFTVFAPTNAAFDAVPGPILNALLADPEGLLTSVLTYHVLAGHIDPRYYYYARTLPTVAGQNVFINRDRRSADTSRVNNSSFSCQGVRTNNGIVWIIDSVLQPQFTQ